MKYESYYRRAYPIKDRGHRFEIAEVDVEGPECRDDHEVWKNECPAAGPRSPESTAKIGDEDADLDGKWPRQPRASARASATCGRRPAPSPFARPAPRG